MGWLEAVGGDIVTGLFNQRSANKQMRFESDMSNTAYQRGMRDMKAAGLNPMLAAKLGGASTPSGASANMPSLGGAINTSESIANQKKMTNAQIELMKSQASLNSANAAHAQAQAGYIGVQTVAGLPGAQAGLYRGQTGQAKASEALSRSQSSMIVSQQQAGLPAAQAEAAYASAEASRQNVEKMVQEINASKMDVMIKGLSLPEHQAMANVYRMVDGDVGRAVALLRAMKQGGAGIDNLINILGISSLLKKITFSKGK